MNGIALLIIIVGFPLSLIGYLLTRAYCRALSHQSKPERYSRRASLLTKLSADEERNLRAASDAAVIAAGIVSSTVIHS